ncbi:DUF6250 domain-containing protein [uncultured Bacteroides sp.]|uniref:exo-rhamnogalacturonan lyase family protein n=1 Tax=uncultured Bacteroides sp. TaxID=162156 RepID=UPI002AAB7018|nr:DUF6250 domain-containing protein [uncultured Bacteroides sp.]
MITINRAYSIVFLLLCTIGLHAQNEVQPSGLNSKQFAKYWRVESESPDYKITFLNDTVEMFAPKGLTLWRKEKMSGNVTIEYDACIMNEGKPGDRLSDLNCFWMASDPLYPDNIWKQAKWRNGVFKHCYSLQMYYMGYGGNHNSTTRFRRYDGNYERAEKEHQLPAILKEYTDVKHLLKANQWYHIKITCINNRVCYYINDERLIDYRDPNPHRSGWFGFRTTLSRARITNFSYKAHPTDDSTISLKWIGDTPSVNTAVSFGVPFAKGKVSANEKFSLATARGTKIPIDNWNLAYWPDGSIKWGGFAAVIPSSTEKLTLYIGKKGLSTEHKREDKFTSKANKTCKKGRKDEQRFTNSLTIQESADHIIIDNGMLTTFLSKKGKCIFDSLIYNKTRIAGPAQLICQTESKIIDGANENFLNGADYKEQVCYTNYRSEIKKVTIESQGKIRAVVKIEGVHKNAEREWLPFVVRLYFYVGNEQIKLVHSIIYNGDQHKDFIKGLGLTFDVPLREALYNRHVAFAGSGNGLWSEPVQPLTGRRTIKLKSDRNIYREQMEGKRIPDYQEFNSMNQDLIDHWASWSDYRLSQLSPDAFSIRKRANNNNPWIGTFSGDRSRGLAFVGDVSGGLSVCLQNFWQSYPSSIEIQRARTAHAALTVWLWSPEGEAMDLRHYDNVAHGLNESYEDVQKGLSTPYGIARTSVLMLCPQINYPGKTQLSALASNLSVSKQLICSPEYLQRQHAFGIWSLPDRSTPTRNQVEDQLNAYIDYYQKAIEQHKWYGYWNYGDVMHTYDPERHEWRYDIGGFAWDNTELASNMWLWYSFLRTGRADIWRMAEAMTRHTTEVDVYHLGPNAGLGSRHNVSHWGCGAKEARISQAAWNRFYYYLTTDERSGDLMTEVKDADQKLYTMDPMRLAQPREEYPCTAPARLRIGPDWLAYAGNWMTEWERTRNTVYRDKIIAGMKSIAQLPNGLFTGPKALGFDPATGIISYEGNPKMENTNHLMTIMGGFEVMNELMEMINLPEWKKVWLDHAAHYTKKAWEISHSRFLIPKLAAYAAYQTSDPKLKAQAWNELMPRNGKYPWKPLQMKKILPPKVLSPIDEDTSVSTNSVATWAIDAIYMLEVAPPDE